MIMGYLVSSMCYFGVFCLELRSLAVAVSKSRTRYVSIGAGYQQLVYRGSRYIVIEKLRLKAMSILDFGNYLFHINVSGRS